MRLYQEKPHIFPTPVLNQFELWFYWDVLYFNILSPDRFCKWLQCLVDDQAWLYSTFTHTEPSFFLMPPFWGAKSSSPKALIISYGDNSQIAVPHSDLSLRYLPVSWTPPLGIYKTKLAFPWAAPSPILTFYQLPGRAWGVIPDTRLSHTFTHPSTKYHHLCLLTIPGTRLL